MRRWLKKLAEGERGATFVIVALSMAVLLGFSALVIDMGMLHAQKADLQNALDAAALAGAQELPGYTNATNTAREYFAANGFRAEDLAISFSGSDEITCLSFSTVQTTFARVLGIDKTNTSLMHATAVHTTHVIKSPFDFGVFQGEPDKLLDMGGAAFTVEGGVFSNGAFRSKPGGITHISGVETVSASAPDILGCVTIDSVASGVDPVKMVDMKAYFDELRSDALSGKSFSIATAEQLNLWQKASQLRPQIDGNVIIQGNFNPKRACIITGVVHVTGNVSASAGINVVSGGALIVDGSLSWAGWNGQEPVFNDALIYVGGSITASPGPGGSTFNGECSVYAGGNMYFGGSGFYSNGNTFFYTQNGDLTVTANCNGIDVTGILYAYSGTVILQSKPHLTGAVIGYNIDSFPGGLTITYPEGGLGHTVTEDAYLLTD